MGNMLRVTRESSGVSLEEASNDLNIKQIVLENIEDGKIGAFSDVFQLKTYINDYKTRITDRNTYHRFCRNIFTPQK